MAGLQATHDFHPFYRFFFLWADPILTVAGMYVNFFAHDLATQAFFTDYPPDEHLKPFVYQIGGMGTSFLTIFVLLLRYTEDYGVWRIVQLAITWADFTMLTSMYIGMRYEGNLAVADWRWEDWFSGVTTLLCTLLRIAFVLGIGVTKKRTAIKGKGN